MSGTQPCPGASPESTFASRSTLTDTGEGSQLDLATALGATPGGLVDHPVFFSGFLARPDVAAAGLLAVADVAMARYADPERRAANLDPLVTASGDRLRFESFSACNGVHARFDLLGEGVESAEIAFGTTNVDINQALRTQLARTARAELMHLAVGNASLDVSTPSATHVERKVTLPDRWVRGCAEMPSLCERMQLTAQLRGPQITRFLGELPKAGPPGPTRHMVALGKTARLTAHPVPGSIAVTGTSRLAASARIARYASHLRIYAGPNDTSGWVFEIPGGRLTLILSPGPYRGFSGEGGLLSLLAGRATAKLGQTLLEHLAWTASIDEEHLAIATGMDATQVRAGLAWLAASGRVGFDLAEQTRFHRDLPVDAEQVLRRNPRLGGARRLVDRGAVARDGSGWRVRGDHATYLVADGTCSCPWVVEHGESRGPCKHLLAVALVTETANELT